MATLSRAFSRLIAGGGYGTMSYAIGRTHSVAGASTGSRADVRRLLRLHWQVIVISVGPLRPTLCSPMTFRGVRRGHAARHVRLVRESGLQDGPWCRGELIGLRICRADGLGTDGIVLGRRPALVTCVVAEAWRTA